MALKIRHGRHLSEIRPPHLILSYLILSNRRMSDSKGEMGYPWWSPNDMGCQASATRWHEMPRSVIRQHRMLVVELSVDLGCWGLLEMVSGCKWSSLDCMGCDLSKVGRTRCPGCPGWASRSTCIWMHRWCPRCNSFFCWCERLRFAISNCKISAHRTHYLTNMQINLQGRNEQEVPRLL